jgi:hypothetical protein
MNTMNVSPYSTCCHITYERNSSGSGVRSNAPRIGPASEVDPPMMFISRKLTDSQKVKLKGAM